MSMADDKIILKSTDGEEFPIDEKLAVESILIKEQVELGFLEDNKVIELQKGDKHSLQKIIEWMNIPLEDRDADEDDPQKCPTFPFFEAIYKENRLAFFKMMETIFYLQHSAMENECCKSAAKMLKRGEIKNFFMTKKPVEEPPQKKQRA